VAGAGSSTVARENKPNHHRIKTMKIEKNIPLPTHYKKRSRDYYDIWLKLKPGDSIFYGFEGRNPTYVQKKVIIMKQQFLDDHNLKWEMTTRKVEGGVRIWRIE
jgi:hypothetical protein